MTSTSDKIIDDLRRILRIGDVADQTDGKLLDEFIKSRDEAAFAVLMRRHGQMVWAMCLKILCNPQDAEDAFQATFLVLVRKAASVRPREMVGNWLFGVARQTAIRARTLKAKRSWQEKQVTIMPDSQSQSAYSDVELQEWLQHELSRLPDKYRAVIVLCDLEGKSGKEAARQLGWPEGSVWGRLSKGRALLAKRLSQHGPVLSAGAVATALAKHTASAAMPPALMTSTIKAAGIFAAGQTATAEMISANVAALTDGVIKAMLLSKLKAVTLACLGVGLLGASINASVLPGQSPKEKAPLLNSQRIAEASSVQVKTDESTKLPIKERVDFQGDPLPTGALARLGTIRLRHGHSARDVMFSPDGKVLASAGNDHAVRLWDPATGKELRLFTSSEEERANIYAKSRSLTCVAISPDGKRVAAGEQSDGFRVWDFATAKLQTHASGANGGVTAMAFAPDGSLLATCGRDSTIRFWDGGTFQPRGQLAGHKGAVQSVIWSPDGKMLASAGDDRTIRLWDAAGGRELRQLVGHRDQVTSVAFSPDGQSLASGSRDQTIRLWNLATGKEKGTMQRQGEAVLRVIYAPDGKTIAAATAERTIVLWDVATLKLQHVLEGHEDPVRGLAFSADGKILASAADEGKVGLWDVMTGKELFPQLGHWHSAIALGFVEGDRTLVSMSRTGTVQWWDWRKQAEKRASAGEPSVRGASAFGRDNEWLAVGTHGGAIRLLETKSGKELARLEEFKNRVLSIALSHDGQTLVATDGADTLVWDLDLRKVARRLSGLGRIELVAVAPNGIVFLGGVKTSHLWDLVTNKNRELPLAFANYVTAVFTPNSRTLACADKNGKVQLWDVETGEKTGVLSGLSGYVLCTSVSPDNRFLAAGGWRSIKVWEIDSGLERRGFAGFEGDVYTTAFSADGRTLASRVGGQQMLLWDIPGPVNERKLAAADAAPKLWQDLAAADGTLVHRAVWALAAQPDEAAAYLKIKLKPAPVLDEQRFTQLIKDLDSDLFNEREQATKDLANWGESVELALRKAYVASSSLEVKERVKSILDELTAPRGSPERMQRLRAIEVLERAGTPNALALLRDLASGAKDARSTREAIASLERLRKR